LNPPASEKELGELIGEVRALGKQVAEMRAENTVEHGEVVRRLEELRQEVGGKASEEWVKDHEGRIDSLESTRDEGKGAAFAVKVAQGVGLFLIAALGIIVAKGGI
jgi:hypothetical protein